VTRSATGSTGGGWIELLEQTGISDLDEIDSIVDAVVDEHLDMILEVCAAYPEGTVVTRFGPFVAARQHPFAA
jgi:hypothetical protein